MTANSVRLPEPQEVAQNLKDWTKAYVGFAELLAIGLPKVTALAQWGRRLLRENRSEEAARVFRTATALTPEDPLLWTNLGVALDRIDSPAESALCLERSLTLAPDHAE